MKVKDLIKKLQGFDEALEVVLYTDHGQTGMTASIVTDEIYVEDLDAYMMETIGAEDYEDALGDDPDYYGEYTKVVMIEG